MDVDTLIRTLGAQGCVSLGAALAVALVLCTGVLSLLAYNLAELRSNERVRQAEVEARAEREARLDPRDVLVERLRERGCSPERVKQWLEIYDRE